MDVDEPAMPTDAVIDLAINCFSFGVAAGGLTCSLIAGWSVTSAIMFIVAVTTLRNMWKLTRHWWIDG